MTGPKTVSFILIFYSVALLASIASGHGSHFRQKRGLSSKGNCVEYDYFCKGFGTLDYLNNQIIHRHHSPSPVGSNGARQSLSRIPNRWDQRYSDMAARKRRRHDRVIKPWGNQHQNAFGVPFQYVSPMNNYMTASSALANGNSRGGWGSNWHDGGYIRHV